MNQIHVPETHIGVVDGKTQSRLADTDRGIRSCTVNNQSDRMSHEVDDLNIRWQWLTQLTVVQDERTEQCALRRTDRNRPADEQPMSDGQIAELAPAWVDHDVGHCH